MIAASSLARRLELRWRRRASVGLALGLLLAAAASAYAIIDGMIERRAEVAQLQEEVARLETRAAKLVVGQPIVQASERPDTGEILVASPDAGTSHIQASLRGLAAMLGASEIRIESIRSLPLLTEGGLIAVRSSASIAVPGGRVYDVVNAIEAATPPIVIDAVRIIARSDAMGRPGPSPSTREGPRAELTLTLRVYAGAEAGRPGSSNRSTSRSSRSESAP